MNGRDLDVSALICVVRTCIARVRVALTSAHGSGSSYARTQSEQNSVAPSTDRGSVLLLVLFVCMAVAVIIQTVGVAVLCVERATVDEEVGRARLEEKDQGLVALRQRALLTWAPLSWTVVRNGEAAVEGALHAIEGSADWVMKADTKQQPDVSRLSTSGWVERGRDGIDLPLAALVAESISADPNRDLPWIEIDAAESTSDASTNAAAVGYLEHLPEAPPLGDGCSLTGLTAPWRLDPGWLRLQSRGDLADTIAEFTYASLAAQESRTGEKDVAGTYLRSWAAVAPTSQVVVVSAPRGRTVTIPKESGRGVLEAPILVVVRGGADLDAQNLGDVFGVFVVDEGSVFLDGTVLHGALFVSKKVHLGVSGRVAFSRTVLRWATDRSLIRTRLVPGTRWEGME